MEDVKAVVFHAKNGTIQKIVVELFAGHVTLHKDGAVEIQSLEHLAVWPSSHDVDLRTYVKWLQRKNGKTRIVSEDYEKTWGSFKGIFLFAPACDGMESTPVTFRNGNEEAFARIIASFCKIYSLNEKHMSLEIEQIPDTGIYELNIEGDRAKRSEEPEMCADLKAITEYFGPDAKKLEYNDGASNDRSGYDEKGYSLYIELEKHGSARERVASRRELLDLLQAAGFPNPKDLHCLGGTGVPVAIAPPELHSRYDFQGTYPRVPTFGIYTPKDNTASRGPERICTVETPVGIVDVVLEDLVGRWYYIGAYLNGHYLYYYNHDLHKAIFTAPGDTVEIGGYVCTVLENAAGPRYRVAT